MLEHLLSTKPTRKNIYASMANKKKVFVGLSGGVDSSVSAALLLRAGYAVTGVFIKAWSPDWMECTWREDRRDAMRVCAHLQIPFQTLDLEAEYKRDVVDTMLSEYKAGRTPNPDVLCNTHIKFGAFYNWARKMGADYVATGHYAQVFQKDESYSLCSGNDAAKDQVYFLWTLHQEQLQHTFFPVGAMQKGEVRALAQKYGLPTATKKDSQGLCFIGKISMKDFLKHYIDELPGAVLDEKGNPIGHHTGAVFYTIGERHGFVVTKKTSNDTPYYVVAKDILKNTITVSEKKQDNDNLKNLKKVTLSNTHWISQTPDPTKKYTCQIRYHGEKIECSISFEKGQTVISFKDAHEGVSVGQSLVLYDSHQCLGGGIIETVHGRIGK